jgi:hypothetical protein
MGAFPAASPAPTPSADAVVSKLRDSCHDDGIRPEGRIVIIGQ